MTADVYSHLVAPNKYGKCVTVGHIEFPVMLAYGCSSVYFKWAVVWVIMTENTKLIIYVDRFRR